MTRSPQIFKALIFVILFYASTTAYSQTGPTESHLKAAKEVYMLVGGANAANSAADAILEAIAKSTTDIDKVKPVIMKWCNKVFSGSDFENEMIAIYTKHFSEQELNELSKFYKTEVGKKITAALPILMKEGAAVGAKHGQLHQSELIQMLAEASK